MTSQSLRIRREAVLIELAILLGRNHRDFVIQFPILVDGNSTLTVGQSVTVKLGRLGFARQFAKLLAEELLFINTEILVTEEDNATLRHFDVISIPSIFREQDQRNELEIPP